MLSLHLGLCSYYLWFATLSTRRRMTNKTRAASKHGAIGTFWNTGGSDDGVAAVRANCLWRPFTCCTITRSHIVWNLFIVWLGHWNTSRENNAEGEYKKFESSHCLERSVEPPLISLRKEIEELSKFLVFRFRTISSWDTCFDTTHCGT